MSLTDKQKRNYYLKKHMIEGVVKSDAAEDDHIIHGARAINAQVPRQFRSHTKDFDMFAKNPKKESVEMEKKLDKSFGGDFFKVKKGKNPSTWKVKSRVTKDAVVDYTKPDGSIKSKNIFGVKYRDLEGVRKGIKRRIKTGANPSKVKQDREALQRINLAKRGVLEW